MIETHLLIPDRAGWATQVSLVVNLVADEVDRVNRDIGQEVSMVIEH